MSLPAYCAVYRFRRTAEVGISKLFRGFFVVAVIEQYYVGSQSSHPTTYTTIHQAQPTPPFACLTNLHHHPHTGPFLRSPTNASANFTSSHISSLHTPPAPPLVHSLITQPAKHRPPITLQQLPPQHPQHITQARLPPHTHHKLRRRNLQVTIPRPHASRREKPPHQFRIRRHSRRIHTAPDHRQHHRRRVRHARYPSARRTRRRRHL